MKINSKNTGQLIKNLVVFVIITFCYVAAFAQNVADSDLSNDAGTNTNWYGQGWFWIIGIVILAILVWAISRDRTKRRLESRSKHDHRFKNVKYFRFAILK